MARIREFWKDVRGTTSIEYALIGGLISILIVTGVTTIGKNLSTRYFVPISNNLS